MSLVDAEYVVKWHPFYLNPNSTTGNKMERYTQKFGAQKVAQMVPYMQSIGAAEGIQFDYGGLIGDTRLSHSVIDFCKSDSTLQNATVEALFQAYFEQQGNIFTAPSIIDTLKKRDVQLDWDALKVHMEGYTDPGSTAISGVPDITINGRYHVSGARDSSELAEIFRRIVT